MLNVKEIGDVSYPIATGVKEENGYSYGVLPLELRRFFDEERIHVLRINSAIYASQIPDFGGRTPAYGSLTPHQDHHPVNDLRFIALSHPGFNKRGSSTYVASPEILSDALPLIFDYFDLNRKEIKETFQYDDSFVLSQTELQSYFEGGLEKYLGCSEEDKLFYIYGILAYLLQGRHANRVVEWFTKKYAEDVHIEDWTRPGVMIIDNARTFHGRKGPNDISLNRTWFAGNLLDGKNS